MAHETQSSRRAFLGALGAGVAAATGGETVARADAPTQIVDFHNHYMGPSWTLTNLGGLPPRARAAWEKINANLQSPDALLGSVETAGITARVINTPTAFIEDADGKVPADAIRRINDQMAEFVDKHPGNRADSRTRSVRRGGAIALLLPISPEVRILEPLVTYLAALDRLRQQKP